MFLRNKYTQYYYAIVTAAQRRDLPDVVERHHIIPRSLGGDNASTNIVALTPREHYICHLLLVRMLPTGVAKRKMEYAVWITNNKRVAAGSRGLTSRQYERLRAVVRASLSATLTGRVVSAETRAKQSASKKVTHNSTETRAKLSAAARARPQHQKDALASLHRGKTISQQHRAAISAKLSGAGNGRALSWSVEYEDGRVEWVTALKTWCLETGRTFPGVFRTIKSGSFSQGVRVSRA